jgi:bifunctional DNA-binding transcriptional regulator/antitoxin component of YhaV-PrlF toxin-antitoxin module
MRRYVTTNPGTLSTGDFRVHWFGRTGAGVNSTGWGDIQWRKREKYSVKITTKGQVTIPTELRTRHGLEPHQEVTFVDQPNGVLVVKAGKRKKGARVLSTLLSGGKVKGHTNDWLKMTRGR